MVCNIRDFKKNDLFILLFSPHDINYINFGVVLYTNLTGFSWASSITDEKGFNLLSSDMSDFDKVTLLKLKTELLDVMYEN